MDRIEIDILSAKNSKQAFQDAEYEYKQCVNKLTLIDDARSNIEIAGLKDTEVYTAIVTWIDDQKIVCDEKRKELNNAKEAFENCVSSIQTKAKQLVNELVVLTSSGDKVRLSVMSELFDKNPNLQLRTDPDIDELLVSNQENINVEAFDPSALSNADINWKSSLEVNQEKCLND